MVYCGTSAKTPFGKTEFLPNKQTNKVMVYCGTSAKTPSGKTPFGSPQGGAPSPGRGGRRRGVRPGAARVGRPNNNNNDNHNNNNSHNTVTIIIQ